MHKAVIYLAVCLLAVPFNAHGVDFTLFGDVVYFSTSDEQDNNNTFQLGEFDLIAAQEIGEATFVTAELVFEDAGHGYEVDVERFGITRTFRPLLTVGLGRFHTQLGVWNQNFHHGSLIQDTISRPFFLEYEDVHGGIFPNHIVGLHINGENESWNYQFSYANSNGIDTTGAETHPDETTLEIINSADPSNDKAVVLRLAYKDLPILSEAGVFFMINQVVELGETHGTDVPFVAHGDILFDQQIVGFDLRYTGETFYSLFELFSMINDDNNEINAPSSTGITPNPDSYRSLTYYWQLGYHLTDKLSLVGRYEYLDYDANATYFQLLEIPRQDRSVMALNYKLQESNYLRFEVSKAEPKGSETISRYGVQWFFIMF